MSEEAAFQVFAGILLFGIVVWLIALLVHRRVFRPADPEDPQVLARGEVMIEAPAAEVSRNTVAALRGGLQGIGPVRLEAADERRIAGEITFVSSSRGAMRRSPIGGGAGFEVELAALGSRTAAKYWIVGSSGGCLRTGSALFVYFLIPVMLAAAGYLVPKFIVGSEEPAIRYQVFQTFQIIHVLWPPFLFAGLRNRVARVVTRSLENVLSNSAF